MEICPGENARAAHPRRRNIFGVAVRNTNPRRIRRYAARVEIALPSGNFVTRCIEKAADGLRQRPNAGFENECGLKCRQPRYAQSYQPAQLASVKNETQEPTYRPIAIRPVATRQR
jgi:hypothetical protein